MATVERFIPAKSRLVVCPQKPGAAAVWHELKRDLILPADDELAKTECPITKEAVNWFTREVPTENNKTRFALYFPDRVIRVRLKLEPGDLDDARMAHFKPVYLTYDIPDDAQEFYYNKKGELKSRPFPNPSAQLRQFAIRVNKSDWLMDAGDIPQTLIAKMLDAGATPRPVRLHPDDAKKHIEEAILALQKEVIARVKSAEASLAYANEQLAMAGTAEAQTEAERDMTPEKAEKRYRARAKQIGTELTKLAGDLTKAVERFGIGGNIVDQIMQLGRLSTTAETITNTMQKQADAYRAATAALAAVGTADATAMANAAANDQAATFAMADMLREAGNDAAADALTAAFAPSGGAGATNDDDDEFSLVDVVTDEAAA